MKAFKYLKSYAIIAVIAALHLFLCKLIVTAVRAIINTDAYQITGIKILTNTLVTATKVLYFPLLSLSLYSRQYFPGPLIYIVIIANSLIWAVAIYMAYRIYKKFR